ncbi:MAG: hypothetical protein ACLRXC_08120 [[Clostridium] leptum]
MKPRPQQLLGVLLYQRTSGTVTFSGPTLMTTLMMVPSGTGLVGILAEMVPLGLSLWARSPPPASSFR